MPVTRVERLVFGVTDIPECTKFFDTLGLARSPGATGITYQLPSGQRVELRQAADPDLPATDEQGSTVREVIWGVDSAASLEALAADLGRDREITRDADGTIHARDDIGMAIGFTVEQGRDPGIPGRRTVNAVIRPADPPSPVRLAHVVYHCPRGELDAARNFYIQRLGFRESDLIEGMGSFMRAPGNRWHHNLFMLAAVPKKGWHHCAFDMDTLDGVFARGRLMIAEGFGEPSLPGRHVVGSNVFWHFHAPCGGIVELSTDMDEMDDDWKTQVWEKPPLFDQWQLSSLLKPSN